MKLKHHSPIVSIDWLYKNLASKNLIILDASFPKVGEETVNTMGEERIKGSIYFDLKNIFQNKNSNFPNTIPTADSFQNEVQKLGINNDSCIVVYDTNGIYASPRVWWLFNVFGFSNIAVLDGGFSAWSNRSLPVQKRISIVNTIGDFIVKIDPAKLKLTSEVLEAIPKEYCIVDARSNNRFLGRESEPRKELKVGHIPTSKNLPFTTIIKDGYMLPSEELRFIFQELNPNKESFIFTCGSGITACILALGAAICDSTDFSVYDGSWTEWASTPNLPIEI